MAVTCSLKARPFVAWVNAGLAVVLFIVACGTISGAVALNLDGLFASPGPLRAYSDSIFLATLIAGLALIVISLLGCATVKIETRLVPVCYGLFLFPVFLVYASCAGTLANMMRDHKEGLQSFCDPSVEQHAKLREVFETYVKDID